MRKLFASFFVLIFAFLLPPLLILESIAATFFNETAMQEKILPASYDPVMTFAAEQFSPATGDAQMLKLSIREMIPKEIYTELFVNILKPFFQNKPPSEIDLTPLKARLKKIGREQPEYFISTVLSQEIPARIAINLTKNREAQKISEAFFSLKNDLWFFLLVFSFLCLSLLAFIIFSPLSVVLKWLSHALIAPAAFITLFIVSMKKLPSFVAAPDGFSAAALSFIEFIVKVPLDRLTTYAFFLWAACVILWGSAFLLRGH